MILKIPFEKYNNQQIKEKVLNEIRPKIEKFVPEIYSNLIERCWSQEPEKCPSFEQIVYELKTNSGFITYSVILDDFLDYVDYIINYKTTFKSKNFVIQIDEFIKQKSQTFQKISINQKLPNMIENIIHPKKGFKKLNSKCQQLVIDAEFF